MKANLLRVEAAIKAIVNGEVIVVTDDDDRENEGDLVLAAARATPGKVAFIVRHTCGIVCAPMSPEIARRLHLEPMVATNDAPLGTAFTVSVDFREGMTTGISAEERCNTVRAMANPDASAGEFVRPGHVFPLIARDGGVLIRSGHTEAAVDLCRLSDLPEVGVICELVNDDGTVTRGTQVTAFALAHGLKTVSVADLIAWRQRRESLVEWIEEFEIDTRAGRAKAISFRTPFDPTDHLAVVFGDIAEGRGIPVRLYRESVVDDVFGAGRALGGLMDRMAANGRGVIVYLRDRSVGVAAGSLRPRGELRQGGDRDAAEAESHHSAQDRAEEWREIGLGAQILRQLGIVSIQLLSTRERRYVGLDGFGLEIESTELIDG